MPREALQLCVPLAVSCPRLARDAAWHLALAQP